MVFAAKSLCCISLPQAGLTIGCLTIISSLWNITYLISALIAFDDQTPGIQINFYGSTEIILLQIVACLLIAFGGFLLIAGTNKNSHRMLLPWLVIGAIVWMYATGWTLYFLVFGFGRWEKNLGLVLVSYGLAWIFFSGLGFYIWLVVFSLYRSIQDEQRRKDNQLDVEKLNEHPYAQPYVD